jgi:hypothetical protein
MEVDPLGRSVQELRFERVMVRRTIGQRIDRAGFGHDLPVDVADKGQEQFRFVRHLPVARDP